MTGIPTRNRRAFLSSRGRAMLVFVLVSIGALLAPGATASAASQNYRNPLDIRIPGDGRVESCADPTVIRSQTAGDNGWYMYCTTDPLNDQDKSAGNFNFHLIPTMRSTDLVNWTYVGDAFATRPAWVAATSGLWAPEVVYINGLYYLYYTAPDTSDQTSGEPNCGGDSAIGVATSTSPTGPWTDSGGPVVAPRRNGAGCNFFWTYDPDVIQAHGSSQRYIYYGSYYGGVQARQLSADGMHSDPATAVQITTPNRYEGSEVIYHGGYYYYLGSATNCCNGPLTGYSVFVGRSQNPLGPFVDRDGVSLLNGRVGGSVFLTMNGNRWVGPGHQTTFPDFDGQWWTIYHAVNQNDPYFAGATGFTKRPALLDPVDWVNGWPTVRGGLWASDTPVKQPAAQPGERTLYKQFSPPVVEPGALVASDDFNGGSLGADWSWVREPASGTWSVGAGAFHIDTQAADLYVDSNNASVLLRNLPAGNWIAETKVRLNLPAEGCCFNYVQAGMVVYQDDDNFLKLAHVSIWETRQTEWAKEEAPVPNGYPRYGNTVVTAPGEWTWFRIAHWETDGIGYYEAFVSRDGVHWNRGGVWTHDLQSPSLGLISMGGSGFTADFDYVRIYGLHMEGSRPAQ